MASPFTQTESDGESASPVASNPSWWDVTDRARLGAALGRRDSLRYYPRFGVLRSGAVVLGLVAVATALTNAGPIALFLFPAQVVDPVTVEERQLYTGLGADELGATPAGWSQSYEYREDPPTLDQLASVDSTIMDGGDCEDYAAAVLAYLWGQGESASIVYYVSLDSYDAHMAVVDEDGLHYSSGVIGDYPARAYADVNGYELVLKRKATPPG